MPNEQRIVDLFNLMMRVTLRLGAIQNVLQKHGHLPSEELNREIERLRVLADVGEGMDPSLETEEARLERLRKMLNDTEGATQ